jgi:hypothetical protein
MTLNFSIQWVTFRERTPSALTAAPHSLMINLFFQNVRLQEKDGNFTLNSVSISSAGHEHAGRYYCYAINGVGHAQAELAVVVLRKYTH